MRTVIKTIVIDLEEQRRLCSLEENHFFDKKSSRIDPASVLKHVVAFANSDGGEIIIGIKDDKEDVTPENRWDGLASIEHYNGVFQSMSLLNPPVDYSATFIKSANNQQYALRLNIEKSNRVHASTDEKVYVRRSAQSILVKSHRRIQELSFEKGESSYEDVVLSNYFPEDVTESREIQRFLAEYSLGTDSIDFVTNTNLIDRETFNPKVAGVLLFSNSQQI